MVVILLAIVESYLDGYEDSRLQSEILLSSIEDNAAEIAIAEYRAIREGEVGPEIAKDVAENRREAAETLDDLERLNPEGGEVAQVGQSLAAYGAAVEEELALIEAGRLDEARTVDEERVDPGYEALHELLEDTKTRYDAEAQRADLFVKMATYGTALLAAIVLVVVIRLWQREAARRSEEEALERSEERFRSLAQNSSDVISVVDAEGTILYESPSVERVFGHKPEDLVGGEAFGRVHPDNLARVRGVFAEVLKRPGVAPPVEVRVRHRDGSWRHVEAIGNNLLDDPGVGGIVINTRDITERKQAEEEVKEQRMFLRQVIDTDPNLVFVKDWDGRFTLVNQAVADVYGTTTEELVGRSDADFNANEEEVKTFLRTDREVMEKFRARHVPEGTVTDARTGERRWFQTVKVPLAPSGGEPRRVLGVSTEITMRKRAEEALKESEERFRALVESGLDLVTLCDADNTIRYISPSVRRILGYEPEEMIGLYVPSVVHPDDLEYAAREAEKLLRNPAQNPAPIRYRRKDGSYAYLESVARNCLDDPSVEGIVVHSRDVTERVEAEEELRRSEQRYRAVIEQAWEGIFLFDAGTKRILETNPAFRRMLGHDPEEMERMTVYDLVPGDPESVDRNVRRNLEQGHLLVGERQYRRKDGSSVDVEASGSVISYGGKGVVCAVVRDITERKRAEEALQESHDILRGITEGSTDAIFMKDLQGRYLMVNSTCAGLFGRPVEEMVGMHYGELFGPDEARRIEEDDRQAISVGETRTYEETLTFGGRERTYLTTRGVHRDHRGNVAGVFSVARDITERKRAEEDLRRSEARNRAILEAYPDLVFRLSRDGEYLDFQANEDAKLYVSREEIIGRNVRDTLPPAVAAEALVHLARALETSRMQILEYRLPVPEGPRDFEARFVATDTDEALCIIRDITERKQADRMLREQSVAMDNSIDGIAILDCDGLYTYLNDAHLKVYGYDAPEELLGKSWKTLYGEDQLAWLEEHVLPVLEEGGFWRGEMIGKRRDGSTFPQEISIASIEGSALVCVVRDITSRKRAEDALRESEERYRAVVERTADGVFLGDFETNRILESNAALQKMLGYTAEELRGMSLYEIIDDDPEGIDRNGRRILEERSFLIGERRYRRKDGSVVDVDTSATLIPYGDKDVSCLIARDVTDRKRAEAELKSSLERLSALNEASRILGSTLEAEEIGRRLLEITERVTNLTAAAVYLPDNQGELRVGYTLGPKGPLHRVASAPAAEVARRDALEAGGCRRFRVLGRSDRDATPLMGLCVPLRLRDRNLGVLQAYGMETPEEGTTVETLTGLANQAASALENARLYAELAEHEGQLRGLVGKLIMAQEEERRRVAREVHDGLTQMLVAAHQHLQSFADYHPPASPDAREELEWVMGVVQRTVGEARRVIADLRPTALDDFGLATALRLQADALSAEGWEVAYEESLGGERLPVEVETALFRVAQEALTNVRKHARTRRARVELRRRGGVVGLRVRDWGCGFSPDAAMSAGGAPGERVGLSSMRERVALLGGKLEIDSRPGAGASVAAELPLPREGGYPLGGA